jgi:hypothetical protein
MTATASGIETAGRAGALKSWSQTSDKAARTKPGRDAFLDKFAREVDPDGTLPEEERRERALYARRAYMTKLARQSARVRREKALPRKGQSDETTIENDACATISVHFRNRAGTPTGGSA